MNVRCIPSTPTRPCFQSGDRACDRGLAVGRWVCVSRMLQNGWTREYCGTLSDELRVGGRLSVMLDPSNCLLSSKIRAMATRADTELVVETQHSAYLVRAVEGGVSSDDDAPVRKVWRASA